MTNEYPRLCGGTFFTLLLQARKQRSKARAHRIGERDGLSEPDVLVRLIKIMNPDYIEPTPTTEKTFKGNAFGFKSCKISDATYLPLGDATSFDYRITQEYQTPLRAMYEFVDQAIDIGTSLEKDIRLVKALLELIELDMSIDVDQEFYVCENGSTMKKATLSGATDICLPSFLLGVWHFILTNRKDNTIGKETYESWCPSQGGGARSYIGKMGDGITQNVSITGTPFSELKSSRTTAACEPDLDKIAADATQTDKRATRRQTSTNPRYSVILLDDDIYRAEQYADALCETLCFDCDTVYDAKSLFQRVRTQNYDAYILDIHIIDAERYFGVAETLGGWRTGLVVYQKLRDMKPDSIIVALTHSELPEAVEWFTSDESSAYFNKQDYPPHDFSIALLEFLRPLLGDGSVNNDCNEPRSFEENASTHTTTQILNAPAVFINHGANGIQINNNGTLNLDRGGGK